MTSVFIHPAACEGFELLGSIPSSNGLYYTTMAPRSDFIAMGDQRSPGAGIDIVYVGDPVNMTLAGNVQTGHMTYQLAWSGDYVYAPASWDGLFIYDVSNHNNIFPVYSASFGEPITIVGIRNEVALVSGSSNFYSIDISNPLNPSVIWSSGALGCDYFILGDSIAYAYRLYNDVIIIDISNPEAPQEISRFHLLGVNGICVGANEDYLYLTGQRDGLIIYDISDPGSPVFISHTVLPDSAWCIDLCLSEKYPNILFVSAYIDGLWAVNVSDPLQPVPLHHYVPPSQDHYVMFYNGVLFHTIYNELLALDYNPGFTNTLEGNSDLPADFYICQNNPNPFNASTTIKYNLPYESEVSLSIYNLLGQRVETLFEGNQNAGEHTNTWNASHLPSGIYFARLETADRTENIKMVLLK
jgi:hypothetical protein